MRSNVKDFLVRYGRKIAFLAILLFAYDRIVSYLAWHPKFKHNFWTYVGDTLSPLMIIAVLGTIFWFVWKRWHHIGAALLLAYGVGLGIFMTTGYDFTLVPLLMLGVVVVLLVCVYGTIADRFFPEKVTTWWHNRQEQKASKAKADDTTTVQPVTLNSRPAGPRPPLPPIRSVTRS